MKILSRLNRIISAGALGLVGLLQPMAALGALGTAAWVGEMLDMFPDWLENLGLLAIGVWAGASWLEPLRERLAPRWPDFSRWDGRETIKAGDAAYLFLNKEPQRPIRGAAKRELERMREQFASGGMPIETASFAEELLWRIEEAEGKMPRLDPELEVRREDLIAYAGLTGQRPPFLFTEERVR